MVKTWRPTKKQLAEAVGKTVPDVIAPGLKVLFVGINPGLYSAAIGHHFGRPGNRFYPALAQAGITDRQLSPFEESKLPEYGCGVTNLVERATPRADDLTAEEFRTGARKLAAKLRRYRPGLVAFLGITAYRTAFDRRAAEVGRQDEAIAGVPVWVLPNPSGLNAHYQLDDFVRLFRRLWSDAADT